MHFQSFFSLIFLVCVVGVQSSPLINERSTLSCDVADIQNIKSVVAKPVYFCKWWQKKTRNTTPFVDLTASQVTAACKCISPISSTKNKRSDPTPEPIFRRAQSQASCAKELFVQFSQPYHFCQFYNAMTETSSPFEAYTAKELTQECKCVLGITSTSTSKKSSSTKKTTSTKTSSTVKTSSSTKKVSSSTKKITSSVKTSTSSSKKLSSSTKKSTSSSKSSSVVKASSTAKTSTSYKAPTTSSKISSSSIAKTSSSAKSPTPPSSKSSSSSSSSSSIKVPSSSIKSSASSIKTSSSSIKLSSSSIKLSSSSIKSSTSSIKSSTSSSKLSTSSSSSVSSASPTATGLIRTGYIYAQGSGTAADGTPLQGSYPQFAGFNGHQVIADAVLNFTWYSQTGYLYVGDTQPATLSCNTASYTDRSYLPIEDVADSSSDTPLICNIDDSTSELTCSCTLDSGAVANKFILQTFVTGVQDMLIASSLPPTSEFSAVHLYVQSYLTSQTSSSTSQSSTSSSAPSTTLDVSTTATPSSSSESDSMTSSDVTSTVSSSMTTPSATDASTTSTSESSSTTAETSQDISSTVGSSSTTDSSSSTTDSSSSTTDLPSSTSDVASSTTDMSSSTTDMSSSTTDMSSSTTDMSSSTTDMSSSTTDMPSSTTDMSSSTTDASSTSSSATASATPALSNYIYASTSNSNFDNLPLRGRNSSSTGVGFQSTGNYIPLNYTLDASTGLLHLGFYTYQAVFSNSIFSSISYAGNITPGTNSAYEVVHCTMDANTAEITCSGTMGDGETCDTLYIDTNGVLYFIPAADVTTQTLVRLYGKPH